MSRASSGADVDHVAPGKLHPCGLRSGLIRGRRLPVAPSSGFEGPVRVHHEPRHRQDEQGAHGDDGEPLGMKLVSDGAVSVDSAFRLGKCQGEEEAIDGAVPYFYRIAIHFVLWRRPPVGNDGSFREAIRLDKEVTVHQIDRGESQKHPPKRDTQEDGEKQEYKPHAPRRRMLWASGFHASATFRTPGNCDKVDDTAAAIMRFRTAGASGPHDRREGSVAATGRGNTKARAGSSRMHDFSCLPIGARLSGNCVALSGLNRRKKR